MTTLPARSAGQLDVVARANKILREQGWYTQKQPEITLTQAEAFMRALSELGWAPIEEE